MNGKTKLAIGSVIIVALVGTVCVSVAAFAGASSNAATETGPKQALLTKVADNLGLGYDQVLGAFDKAQQELSSEALQQRLDQAVGNGTITQDEADQIIAWMNSEPAAAANLSQGWLNGLLLSSSNFSGSATSNLSAPPGMGKGFPGMRPSGNSSDNMSRWAHDNHMRSFRNSSDNGTFNQSNMPGMGNGFPDMRRSGNPSDNVSTDQGGIPNGGVHPAGS